jgi:ribosome-associated toxin RatA of RatAB toxin-antitoxin module
VEGYPRFMPYVAECRILKRDGNSIYSYQRISPKIVADRDYALHIEEKSHLTADGTVYSKQWRHGLAA